MSISDLLSQEGESQYPLCGQPSLITDLTGRSYSIPPVSPVIDFYEPMFAMIRSLPSVAHLHLVPSIAVLVDGFCRLKLSINKRTVGHLLINEVTGKSIASYHEMSLSMATLNPSTSKILKITRSFCVRVRCGDFYHPHDHDDLRSIGFSLD